MNICRFYNVDISWDEIKTLFITFVRLADKAGHKTMGGLGKTESLVRRRASVAIYSSNEVMILAVMNEIFAIA